MVSRSACLPLYRLHSPKCHGWRASDCHQTPEQAPRYSYKRTPTPPPHTLTPCTLTPPPAPLSPGSGVPLPPAPIFSACLYHHPCPCCIANPPCPTSKHAACRVDCISPTPTASYASSCGVVDQPPPLFCSLLASAQVELPNFFPSPASANCQTLRPCSGPSSQGSIYSSGGVPPSLCQAPWPLSPFATSWNMRQPYNGSALQQPITECNTLRKQQVRGSRTDQPASQRHLGQPYASRSGACGPSPAAPGRPPCPAAAGAAAAQWRVAVGWPCCQVAGRQRQPLEPLPRWALQPSYLQLRWALLARVRPLARLALLHLLPAQQPNGYGSLPLSLSTLHCRYCCQAHDLLVHSPAHWRALAVGGPPFCCRATVLRK